MEKILLATSNAHKVAEIREIFKELKLEVHSPEDLGLEIEAPVESGNNFMANALIKAKAYYGHTEWSLADDSGIVVPELGGEPGLYSARYAGEGADDEANREKLKARMSEEKLQNPDAYFVCSICLYGGKDEVHHFEAEWHGKLVHSERGDGGFGYDPLFIPQGHEDSAAQMSASQKNSLSHRSQALAKCRRFLESL